MFYRNIAYNKYKENYYIKKEKNEVDVSYFGVWTAVNLKINFFHCHYATVILAKKNVSLHFVENNLN